MYRFKKGGGLPQNFLAKGRLKPGEMNQTEQAYNDLLAFRQQAGEILWFKFEPFKLRLADHKTTYSPDFAVMGVDQVMECHEVKSFWTDDARVKIKVAAAQFPFRFMAFKKAKKCDGGGWIKEDF
jgi:hypothetical protein